jgi:hypothetical protein
MQKISEEVENRIVELLADSVQRTEITSIIKKEFKRKITTQVISKVSRRRKQDIYHKKALISARSLNVASAILIRARSLLARKLLLHEEEMGRAEDLYERYHRGRLSNDELSEGLSKLRVPSDTAIIAITKEMHLQSAGDFDDANQPTKFVKISGDEASNPLKQLSDKVFGNPDPLEAIVVSANKKSKQKASNPISKKEVQKSDSSV